MTRARIICAVILLSLFLVASGQSNTAANGRNAPTDDDGVGNVLAGIVAADNVGDLDGVVSFYAEDAILLPPNDVPVTGKAAIRSRYEEGFRSFRFDIAFSSDEIQLFGEWAFIRGTIRGKTIPKGASSSRILNDKFIMVLHHQENGWKIARLIWNGSDPLPKTSS